MFEEWGVHELTVVKSAPKPSVVGPPVAAVEQPVTYDATAAASSVAAALATDPAKASKRSLGFNDDCGPQPDGYGPKVVPDTVAAFLADQGLQVSSSIDLSYGYIKPFAKTVRRTSPYRHQPLRATRSPSATYRRP